MPIANEIDNSMKFLDFNIRLNNFLVSLTIKQTTKSYTYTNKVTFLTIYKKKNQPQTQIAELTHFNKYFNKL